MKSCKDCRHYRPSTMRGFQHRLARCVSPRAFISAAFASVERKYNIACGPDAAHFEPLPLGRSHGVDWDRAAKKAETFAEMRAFCAKTPGARFYFHDWTPVIGMTYVATIAPRARYTTAEYIAALTTDYDPDPVRVAAE